MLAADPEIGHRLALRGAKPNWAFAEDLDARICLQHDPVIKCRAVKVPNQRPELGAERLQEPRASRAGHVDRFAEPRRQLPHGSRRYASCAYVEIAKFTNYLPLLRSSKFTFHRVTVNVELFARLHWEKAWSDISKLLSATVRP